MLKEACVESFEEAVLAEKQGAQRIELCSELDKDGLTPDFELMKNTCSFLNIPVMVMIRPRAGNFVFSDTEITKMKDEIDQAKKAGAAGVVFGLLTQDNQIDAFHTRLLAEYAQPLQVTFHKAIDTLNDPGEGVKILKEIPEIRRVLTSGGKPTAMQGKDVIRKMIKTADGKIIILVAGKVTDANFEEIQNATGAAEFHGRRIVGELSR